MDLDEMDRRLRGIQSDLDKETKKLGETTKKLYDSIDEEVDCLEKDVIKREYYSFLSEKEKVYQQKNEAYKKLIAGFSLNYLELCEWYVGPELPRPEDETFFDSKDDINQLYFLFVMSLFLK